MFKLDSVIQKLTILIKKRDSIFQRKKLLEQIYSRNFRENTRNLLGKKFECCQFGGILMITKKTRIIDALQENPRTAQIFERFGMGCMGCMGITMETVENGAKMHHISLDDLLKELNAVIQEKPI
jgi:hybrid cluster-associated redox disulfide protein